MVAITSFVSQATPSLVKLGRDNNNHNKNKNENKNPEVKKTIAETQGPWGKSTEIKDSE